ncbi:hypothetical protein Hanom_Chr01g00015221 [Helianthus anomalus]
MPPTVRLEDTCYNILNSVSLLLRIAMQRELLKGTRSLRSCVSGLERVDASDEDPIRKLQLNPFLFLK